MDKGGVRDANAWTAPETSEVRGRRNGKSLDNNNYIVRMFAVIKFYVLILNQCLILYLPLVGFSILSSILQGSSSTVTISVATVPASFYYNRD